MENVTADDINLQTKRKFESTDIDKDGSIVKRSKASNRQTQTEEAEENTEMESRHNLLHFSDDVMLYILNFCSPRELKALSFCCRRLARLCMDRSLWKVVELRQQALGTDALSFYTQCLKPTTSSLYVRGLIGASSAKDVMNLRYVPPDCKCISLDYFRRGKSNPSDEDSNADTSQSGSSSKCNDDRGRQESGAETSDLPGPSSFSSNKEFGNTSPKPFSPTYDDAPNGEKSEKTKKKSRRSASYKNAPECCRKRTICVASITRNIMTDIRAKCPSLRDLRLEFCSLNCNSFPISEFPRTLKILSLKGCKRSNMPFQNPFLFKIQDYLPELEELDLSYCQWLSGHSLLLLSKMSLLKKLWLRGCTGLGECVAYASLSTRFGFRALEFLDVRETSFGDSEVSSFSFLSNLKELYLEPPSSDVDNKLPAEWPEHSGLMESWESEYPCNHVDEYIYLMNKFSNDNDESNQADVTSSVDKTDKDSGSRTSDEDNSANIGVFYRSVVNVSYEERIVPRNVDNQNADRERNNENAPAAAMRQQANQEPGGENGMGVQVGPVGVQVGPLGVHVGPVDVQVGHAGVQVGPVRLQMRPQARPDGPQPENAPRPGIGGVQVGPVEVQVGPDGVQVGLGGVRVEPGWVRAGPDGEVQVELGGVRVDPGWMQIAPGVRVGIEGVEVGPVEVQVAPDGDRREAPPVGLQVGPIEVQVGPVRLEVGREGRQVGPDQRNDARGNRPDNRQQMRGNNENIRLVPEGEADREAGDRNRNVPHAREQGVNIPGVRIDPVWINDNNGDPDRQLQFGINLEVRAEEEPERMNREENRFFPGRGRGRLRGFAPRGDNDGNANVNRQNPGDEDHPLNNFQMEDENAQNPDGDLPRNVHEVVIGRCRYLRGLLNDLRIPYRIRNQNDRDLVPENVHVNARNFDRFFFQRALRRAFGGDNFNLNPDRENAEGERPRRPPDNADGGPNARARRGMEENGQAPNEDRAGPAGERRPRIVGQHNILDGRVHVIYVNPQHPRRPAAEVLVAAGMPRNAGLMMQEGLDLQHLGGTDLVTDASLLHFGDSEQLVHVGGPHLNRRRYSSLEVLVCRGYRGVTDQSLAHLTTAAPALRRLDLVGCNITRSGAEAFASHRPDCKLHYKSDETTKREHNHRRQ